MENTNITDNTRIQSIVMVLAGIQRIIIISTGQICIHIALNFFLNVRHLRTM